MKQLQMYEFYCGVESRNIIKFNSKQNCLKINVNIPAELDRILTFARIFVNPSELLTTKDTKDTKPN